MYLRGVLFLLVSLWTNYSCAQYDSSFGVNGIFESKFITTESYAPRFVRANNGSYYTFCSVLNDGPSIYRLDSNGKEPNLLPEHLQLIKGVRHNTDLQLRDIIAIGSRVYLVFNEFVSQPNSIKYEGVVQCFDQDLQKDSTFGIMGSYTAGSDSTRDLFLEKIYPFQGGILVAGGINDRSDTSRQGMIIKLTLDGNLDSSFGQNGIIFYAIPDNEKTRELFVMKNGFVLVRNTMTSFLTELHKYNIFGSLDSSFANNGVYSLINKQFQAPVIQELLEQKDGKLILAGQLRFNASSYNTLVTRLDSNGTEDNSFGANGTVLIDEYPRLISEEVIGIHGADSNIILGLNGAGTSRFLAAISLKHDGSINDSFVQSGLLFDEQNNSTCLRVDKNGSLLFLGISKTNSLLYARYLPQTISEVSSAEQLINVSAKVYPNPSPGLVVVESDQAVTNYQITDCNGRKLLTHQLPTPARRFEVDFNQMKGVYFLACFNEGGAIISSNRIMLKK